MNFFISATFPRAVWSGVCFFSHGFTRSDDSWLDWRDQSAYCVTLDHPWWLGVSSCDCVIAVDRPF